MPKRIIANIIIITIILVSKILYLLLEAVADDAQAVAAVQRMLPGHKIALDVPTIAIATIAAAAALLLLLRHLDSSATWTRVRFIHKLVAAGGGRRAVRTRRPLRGRGRGRHPRRGGITEGDLQVPLDAPLDLEQRRQHVLIEVGSIIE